MQRGLGPAVAVRSTIGLGRLRASANEPFLGSLVASPILASNQASCLENIAWSDDRSVGPATLARNARKISSAPARHAAVAHCQSALLSGHSRRRIRQGGLKWSAGW